MAWYSYEHHNIEEPAIILGYHYSLDPVSGQDRAYTWTSFLGAISRSFPTSAFPVALIRFSPFSVRARSVIPVCRPFSDHSVSPWRMMKQRGAMLIIVIRLIKREGREYRSSGFTEAIVERRDEWRGSVRFMRRD